MPLKPADQNPVRQAIVAKDAGRVTWIDTLRACLMVLGVVLHSSRIYSTGPNWIVADTATSFVFDWLVELIHLFRVPSFFFLSGYLAARTLRKRNSETFLRGRLFRLLAPLAATALTLNVLQAVIVYREGWLAEWIGGGWQSHTWFLQYLAIYSVVAAGVFKAIAAVRIAGWALPLSAFALTAAEVIGGRFSRILDLQPAGIDAAALLIGGCFFFAGLRWNGKPPSEGLVAALACVPIGFGLASAFGPAPVIVLSHKITPHAWAVTLVCLSLYLASRLMNRQTAATRLLSRSAYTVYLFHHIIVVAMGLLLSGRELPAAVKFFTVVGVALLVTVVLHTEIIERSAWMRLLFNGEPSSLANQAPSLSLRRT